MGKEKIKNLLELADEIERAREAIELLSEILLYVDRYSMPLEIRMKLERYFGIDDSE